MAHVRSCARLHAHARIKQIDKSAAKKARGVIARGHRRRTRQGHHAMGRRARRHLKGIKSAPQYAIAVDRACWQGEAVCAVVAR